MDKILRFFGLIKISDIECTINAIDRSIAKCNLGYLNGEISSDELERSIKDFQMLGYRLIENGVGE